MPKFILSDFLTVSFDDTHFISSLKTIIITIFAEISFEKECYWDKKQTT